MIYEEIEKIRIQSGVTKAFLARKLGVSTPTYSHIANGKSPLTVDRFLIIANVLRIDPSFFFEHELTESANNRGCKREQTTK